MATVKVSSDIGAPVEVVFERFTDIAHAKDRVGGISDIKLLTATGFGLGTRWIETRTVLGRADDAEMEVTAFEKNRGYTITHHKGGARIDTAFSFEPTPSGTRVGVEFGMNGPGLPPGLLAPLEWAIADKVRDVLARDLADLKSSVETLALR
ncbi:MAG: SRPBCC family protein [Vicinamibacterales bacterium]